AIALLPVPRHVPSHRAETPRLNGRDPTSGLIPRLTVRANYILNRCAGKISSLPLSSRERRPDLRSQVSLGGAIKSKDAHTNPATQGLPDPAEADRIAYAYAGALQMRGSCVTVRQGHVRKLNLTLGPWRVSKAQLVIRPQPVGGSAKRIRRTFMQAWQESPT